ncbi:hypothetical protein ACQ5SO_16060 [Rhodovulum sp. DZ06]|uniref:hypothetical protein n=1 Tax=Rhodovulum sp. DZ06 TaxID=3425126 RepID=UPI003D356DE0
MTMIARTTLLLGLAAVALAACGPEAKPEAPALSLSFADPAWNAEPIRPGAHCPKQGGDGMSPAIEVAGIPAGTSDIIVEFNDEGYQPLSYGGGHGIIGYAHDGAPTATLASVPPSKTDLGVPGARLVKTHRAGNFAPAGYLPPCSPASKYNLYSADVKALAPDGTLLAFGEIELGRY